MRPLRPLLAVSLGLVLLAGQAAAGDGIQFNRDIRPILAENCFACHGPDSASRKADLRLDHRDAAIKAGAFEPGKPDDSEAIRRIFSDDASERMPPPVSQKKLTPEQKEILKRWVAAGAEYQPHWSLIAPVRPPLPPVKNESWVRNPIDRFVLSKLDEMGLQPAAEADRRTLARRLYLDLTGLPPPPEEVDAFAADPAPEAYQRLVDRLMASPQWGEHRARYWLDLARYADTHGLHFDNYREVWPYRDWVINAFNQNVPYDRFTIEQLAGDMLPNATMEQRVASGFHRCQVTTNEGGTIPEENLVFYTRDRSETTSKVWLGLTANCAVCHDHKFDPISQKEFYQFSAFFNNVTVGALDGNVKNSPPTIVVPAVQDRPRFESLAKELVGVRSQIDARRQAARPEFDAWLAKLTPEQAAASIPRELLNVYLPLVEGAGNKVQLSLDGKLQDATLLATPSWEPGNVAAKAPKIPAGSLLELPSAGDFEKDQAISFGAWIKLDRNHQTGAVLARMDDQNNFIGWDLWVENGRIGSHIIHHWDDDALKSVSKQPIKPDQWNHVLVTYDGSGKAAGVKAYVNGQPQEMAAAADRLQGSIRTTVPFTLGQRHTSSRLEGAVVQDVRVYGRALSADEVQQLVRGTRAAWLAARPADQRSDAEKNELFPWWLGAVDKPYQELAARLASLEKEEAGIRDRSGIAFVMQERSEPAKAYVLFRGDYDKRREEVTPATFACLPPMPPELPRNRLGLAEWLMRPEQPLTARVAVNRFWQEVFGTGIVRTTGDFGVAGEMPTHQELLDWLAVEFRESGWDVKRMFRLLVTSATYRQSAAVTPEKLEKDPQNRFLSRGPRFRMDAEMIRDYALAASGLLVHTIGGPSVRPYQPPGIWEAVAMPESDTRFYRQDSGEGLYRRSMYTFWKRAAPPASMDIFNAPSREFCTAQRERTDTPLQALVTLNDPQFVEAARRLAETALKQGGAGDDGRLTFVARRLLARSLDPRETAIAQASLKDLLAFYRAHGEEAKQVIAEGASKPDATLDPATLAGWTMLVNEFMNLDEALNK